uniref:Transposon Ty3-I Gag-Pol polyprotein n=1 Tax=Tanacetum cinerariifolium TaxID=118510 RepID=A0A6L2P0A6_TANCI|nr:transposon Ty3-I Gag-Pol polyprotein [Tanacetum cinerariifolium]
MMREFDRSLVESMKGHVIIVVSSRWASRYIGLCDPMISHTKNDQDRNKIAIQASSYQDRRIVDRIDGSDRIGSRRIAEWPYFGVLLKTPDPKQIPQEVPAIEGRKHMFWFHFNTSSKIGVDDFTLDDVLDEAVDTDETIKPLKDLTVLNTPPSLESAKRKNNAQRTMRVKRRMGRNALHLLVDSGKVTYSADVMILPLGGCEMVLEIQWLATLGNIQWNFKTLIMEFTYQDKKVILKGTQQTIVHWKQGNQKSERGKNIAKLSAMSVYVHPATLLKLEINDSIPKPIAEVLEAYESFFNLYRHLPNHKDAVELMVKELLDSGVIRNSKSSFSSPIVMVKKKDGSWRMCVDYMQLNKYKVKDKFPIPVIEELIDEMCGPKVFSKLDLRSGYHQIRMHEQDIHKTTFRTYEGHHKFLVMPFGLTNTPSTFQSFMNSVFKEFLRKFMLVFFDDILVYNKSLQEYVGHMEQVLAVMNKHSLFAKISRCTFITNNVYLGHIISHRGVYTDKSKI